MNTKICCDIECWDKIFTQVKANKDTHTMNTMLCSAIKNSQSELVLLALNSGLNVDIISAFMMHGNKDISFMNEITKLICHHLRVKRAVFETLIHASDRQYLLDAVNKEIDIVGDITNIIADVMNEHNGARFVNRQLSCKAVDDYTSSDIQNGGHDLILVFKGVAERFADADKRVHALIKRGVDADKLNRLVVSSKQYVMTKLSMHITKKIDDVSDAEICRLSRAMSEFVSITAGSGGDDTTDTTYTTDTADTSNDNSADDNADDTNADNAGDASADNSTDTADSSVDNSADDVINSNIDVAAYQLYNKMHRYFEQTWPNTMPPKVVYERVMCARRIYADASFIPYEAKRERKWKMSIAIHVMNAALSDTNLIYIPEVMQRFGISKNTIATWLSTINVRMAPAPIPDKFVVYISMPSKK